MDTLSVAFKEWAVICRALAEGRQALILRKGGIAEAGGQFAPEHNRFWLYPTFVHQQQGGIKPEAAELRRAGEADQPATGTLRLTHFATVGGVFQPVEEAHLGHLREVRQAHHALRRPLCPRRLE